jgi:hypothetical protein
MGWRVGRTPDALRIMHGRLGILRAGGGRRRWLDHEAMLLGTFPDREVARRVGRSLYSVAPKQCELGIPNPVYMGREGEVE